MALQGNEGNHAEDCKEHYYYLDNTPTHSYMKMLYKYPQQAYPYEWLVKENKRRGKLDPEFELIDTGIFNDGKYFDVFIEYAKADTDDLPFQDHDPQPWCAKKQRYTCCRQSGFAIHGHWVTTIIAPSFTWMTTALSRSIIYKLAVIFYFYSEDKPAALFCENETNTDRLYNFRTPGTFRMVSTTSSLNGKTDAVNTITKGTKAAWHYKLSIGGGKSATVRLRLSPKFLPSPFEDFNDAFQEAAGRSGCVLQGTADYDTR